MLFQEKQSQEDPMRIGVLPLCLAKAKSHAISTQFGPGLGLSISRRQNAYANRIDTG